MTDDNKLSTDVLAKAIADLLMDVSVHTHIMRQMIWSNPTPIAVFHSIECCLTDLSMRAANSLAPDIAAHLQERIDLISRMIEYDQGPRPSVDHKPVLTLVRRREEEV